MCVCILYIQSAVGNRLHSCQWHIRKHKLSLCGSLIYQAVTKRLVTLIPSVNVSANYSTGELDYNGVAIHLNYLMCKYNHLCKNLIYLSPHSSGTYRVVSTQQVLMKKLLYYNYSVSHVIIVDIHESKYVQRSTPP